MKITVIGVGNMGSALVELLGREGHLVTACRKSDDPVKACLGAEVVILAVKPKDIVPLSQCLAGKFVENQVVISILAGTKTTALEKLFPKTKIIRMMPNLAITVKKGILGFAEEGINSEQKKQLEVLFSPLGIIFWMLESKMEAFSSIAASSPAFFFVLMEAMIDAGIHLGFTSKEAKKISLSAWEGSVEMIKSVPNKSLEDWKQQITSPGGTTIEGIKELEKHGFRNAFWSAIQAAYKKAEGFTNNF